MPDHPHFISNDTSATALATGLTVNGRLLWPRDRCPDQFKQRASSAAPRVQPAGSSPISLSARHARAADGNVAHHLVWLDWLHRLFLAVNHQCVIRCWRRAHIAGARCSTDHEPGLSTVNSAISDLEQVELGYAHRIGGFEYASVIESRSRNAGISSIARAPARNPRYSIQ